MAILNNCELFYARLNPERPSARFDPENPTWSVQLRTKDKAQRKQWLELGLRVKTVVDEDTDEVSHRVNLSKRAKKKSGEPANPVSVLDSQLKPLDPAIIGNGSIANVRVHTYEFTRPDGTPGKAAELRAIQVLKLVKYDPPAYADDEDFTPAGEMAVEDPYGGPDGGSNAPPAKTSPAATSPKPATPAAPPTTPKVVMAPAPAEGLEDLEDDIPF